jgi:hypothetical protein
MQAAQAVHELQRRIGHSLIWHHMLNWGAVWGFLWGTAILFLRATTHISPLLFLWGAVILPPVMLAAAWYALRRVPPESQVSALLDWQNQCGGLLMAGQEGELGNWQERLPELCIPEIRRRDNRGAILLLASAVFVAAGFLVPQRFVGTALHQLDIGEEVKTLEEKMETLAEEKILASPKAEAFKKRLQQLAQEAKGEEPAKTWEALDHLENTMKKAAEEAAQKTLQNTEKLNQAEALAQALMESGANMDEKLLQEAMAELGEMVKQAIKENEAASKYLGEQTMQNDQNGKLNKEQMKALVAAMQQGKRDNQKKLEKLCRNGMCNNKNLDLNKQLGKCDGSSLSEFLQQNTQNMTMKQMQAMELSKDGKKFGRGGVDRGGDPVPMVFGEGSKEDGAKFKEEALPPASLEALKDSERTGISTSAPDVEKTETQSGALNNSQTAGGSAVTQTILPRHRQAIKQYFARTGEGK